MTNRLLLILVIIWTKTTFSQTANELLIGELTLTQETFQKAQIGDTLVFQFAKKPFKGSIKIHSDKCLYSWATCPLNTHKNDPWCKIGSWENNHWIVFKLNGRIYTLKNITPVSNNGPQRLIVQDIKP